MYFAKKRKKVFCKNRKCILCFSEECRCRSNQKPAPTGIITQMNPYLWTSTTLEVAGVSALRGFGSPILLMSGGAVIYGRVLKESCFRTIIDLLKVAEITQSQQALKIALHRQNDLTDTDENRPSKGEAAEGVENESYNVCLSKNVFETMSTQPRRSFICHINAGQSSSIRFLWRVRGPPR